MFAFAFAPVPSPAPHGATAGGNGADPDGRRNGNGTAPSNARGCVPGGPRTKCDLGADGGAGAGSGAAVGISPSSGACAASAARRGAYISTTGDPARDGGFECSELVNDATEARRGPVGIELRRSRTAKAGMALSRTSILA
jgi:hypothetical protein